MKLSLLLCSLAIGLVAGAAKPTENPYHCMYLGYPDLEYDGKDRTEVLTDKNFNKTVFADGAKSVVFFNDVEADDDEVDQYECFMQLSAQILEKRGYKFFTVNTTKEVKLMEQEDVEEDEDEVIVFEDGYQIEYDGIRNPETFVSWVMDIPDEPLTIINDKDDKREFEEIEDESVRIVGYFEPGSQALEEFEEAAEEYMGEIEFFAVVDSYWARKMGLDRVGEVHMYHPFIKDPIEAPESADTEDEFEDWVDAHKEPVMQKLTPSNYYGVWTDSDDDEHMVVAFVDEEEKEGAAVFKLLKNLARENTEHAGTLEIVLIDPDEFPLMVDTWEEMFDVEIEEGPIIALVDIATKDELVFDMAQLNLEEPKKHKESNLEVLQAWIDQILDGSISLDDDDDEPEPPKKAAAAKGKKKKEL
jgi:hypothetical protein